jgi:5-methylcytosine-specific restriction endonuclease McrA
MAWDWRTIPLQNWKGEPCPYCGLPMHQPSRDHLRPRSKGFVLSRTNRVIVCAPCNTHKGDRMIEEFCELLRKRGDARYIHVRAFINSGFKQRLPLQV